MLIDMEILIPGLILVALMAWASTKIKKAAAAAYERETIDVGDVSIVKPEGLINPVGDDDSPYVFEAHSKDYGDEDTHRRERQLSAYVGRFDGTIEDSAREVREKTLSAGGSIIREYQLDGSTVIETADGDGRTVTRRIAPAANSAKGVYILKVVALDKNIDAHTARIDELIRSFRVDGSRQEAGGIAA